MFPSSLELKHLESRATGHGCITQASDKDIRLVTPLLKTSTVNKENVPFHSAQENSIIMQK